MGIYFVQRTKDVDSAYPQRSNSPWFWNVYLGSAVSYTYKAVFTQAQRQLFSGLI